MMGSLKIIILCFSLGQEDPLEKEMAMHSGTLAWKIPWMEEPGGHCPWGCKESAMTERIHSLTHSLLSWCDPLPLLRMNRISQKQWMSFSGLGYKKNYGIHLPELSLLTLSVLKKQPAMVGRRQWQLTESGLQPTASKELRLSS